MATEIKIKNLPEGFQSIITNGKHSIITDETIHSKGTDLGLASSELVLAGLAMCKVATVRHIASIPALFLMQDQKILEKWQGYQNEAALEALISRNTQVVA